MGAASGQSKIAALLLYDIDSWVLSYMAESLERHLGGCGDLEVRTARTPDSVAEWKRMLPGIDIVHFLSPWDFFRWADVVPRPIAVTVHHLTGNTIRRLRTTIPLADGIASTNPQCQRQLVELGLARPDEVLRIRYGIDTTRFRPITGARERLVARLGVSPDTILLGFSAKPTSDDGGRKGVDRYWRLIERLRETLDRPVALALFGPGPERPDGWTKEHVPASVASSVHLPGAYLPADELVVMYSGLDYYLCLSRIEGGPYPVFETMACGVVNFSTPVGIVPELITDGESGFIVSEEDYLERIPRLIRELSADPERRAAIARRAIAAADAQFSWRTAADPDLYRKLYRRTLENHAKRPFHWKLRGRVRYWFGR